MAKRTAGGGVELSSAEVKQVLQATQSLARVFAAILQAPDIRDEASAKRFAAHVRWHVKRPHRSRSCQFCP